jgi:hypothetical protein
LSLSPINFAPLYQIRNTCSLNAQNGVVNSECTVLVPLRLCSLAAKAAGLRKKGIKPMLRPGWSRSDHIS